ncbi:MAG: indole-3-glycerol phosphate synthase TrpC [Candidatus Marinimicrobia bacterium]|nr:indole-3-glycerol phosphate synthase TrpC [Candidatus Neomarinimicrobiota bacterium]
MNILEKIILHKQEEVKERSRVTPIERIKGSQRLYAIRDFRSSLSRYGMQIIAEIKRRSPSSGDIMADADPAAVAKAYEQNGAAAISILTDQEYFGGTLEFIQQVKEVSELPILRKDFIISEYQIWESFQAGADAILLIADAIDIELLSELYNLASGLGLHVLVETHNPEYLEAITILNPEIVGINCRNLKTMETSVEWFEEVFSKLPKDCIKVAESGINLPIDLANISQIGYDAALVGTSLMKTGNPGNALAKILMRVPA